MALVALQSGPEDLLLFVPSDHHMPDRKLFCECVLSCISDAEQGNFVLLDLSQDEPNTGYGYIKATAEKQNPECLKVESFIDKPNVIDAKKFIQSV